MFSARSEGLPQLQEIREKAQRGFPVSMVHENDSVLCLFGGSTRGRAELIHLADAGIKQVLVADEKSANLEDVRAAFPDHWEYRVADPASVCRNALARGGCDVLVCDGSRAAVSYIWEDLLPLALAVSKKLCILRITGEYLDEFKLERDPASIRKIAEIHHGLSDLGARSLEMRSNGNGGTYWAIIDTNGRADQDAVTAIRSDADGPSSSISYGVEHTIKLRDQMGEYGCKSGAGVCDSSVKAFRSVIARKERAPVFRAYTTQRFAKLSPHRIDGLQETAAAFALSRYASMDEVWEAARLTTSKRGTVNRKVQRAKRMGYYAKQFNPANHTPDIYQVNTSMNERGGKEMRPNFLRTVEELGGYPTELKPISPRACSVHGNEHWGVFRQALGHCQGSIEVGEELVGYINLVRYGNHAWYSTILGHGDHLQFGVMYLLHFTIVEKVLRNQVGLEYIMYSGMNSRGAEGPLYKWKKRCLFEPKYIIYDDAGDWREASIWGASTDTAALDHD